MALLNLIPGYDGNHGITAVNFLKGKFYDQENQGEKPVFHTLSQQSG